jgi:hypothetical protein
MFIVYIVFLMFLFLVHVFVSMFVSLLFVYVSMCVCVCVFSIYVYVYLCLFVSLVVVSIIDVGSSWCLMCHMNVFFVLEVYCECFVFYGLCVFNGLYIICIGSMFVMFVCQMFNVFNV